MKPGTIVMLRAPAGSGCVVPNGAVGEVAANPSYKLEIGYVLVDFPQHPSWHPEKTWKVTSTILIPLSGPDIDVEDNAERSYSDGLRVGEKA